MATPPASYGYPKAAITADKLPIWQQPLARFTVAGVSDWKVSSLASIDRGIRVEAGMGSGDAVTDQTFEYETMSLPSPPIASAWYLIVRRRNWSGNGTSTLVAIRGTATKTLPVPGTGVANRRDVPGAESDQPLALVRVTQKDTTVQEIVDLRCWASNGGVEVVDRLALDYLGTPGAAVKLGTSTWRYEAQSNGVWGWTDRADEAPSVPLALTYLYSADPPRADRLAQEAPSAYREGRRVHLSGVASNKVNVEFTGGVEYSLALIPADFRPAKVEYFTIEAAFTMCRVWVRPDGHVYFMFPVKVGPLAPRNWRFSLSGISYAAA